MKTVISEIEKCKEHEEKQADVYRQNGIQMLEAVHRASAEAYAHTIQIIKERTL